MYNCAAVTLLYGLTLGLWQLSYFYSCLSVAFLFPLWVVVFVGSYLNALERRRTIILAAVRSTSRFTAFLSGRLMSWLRAFVVSFLSVSIVALQALFAGALQMTMIVLCVATSVSILLLLRRAFAATIQASALSWFSALVATVVATCVLILPFAVIEWSFVERPGYIRLGFDEAMSASLADLPRRGDVINEIVSIFKIADAATLWLVSRFTGTATPGFLFCIHSALICAAISTGAVAASSCYLRYTRNGAQPGRRSQESG